MNFDDLKKSRLEAMGLTSTRKETLKFDLQLDKEKFEVHYDEIKKLFNVDRLTVNAGDSLLLHYTLDIHYFGQVSQALTVLLYLVENGIVSKSNIQELEHGVCLIQEVLVKLNNLIEKSNE